MKINRNINGVDIEIELTDLEIEQAYREYWLGCLAEDIKARIHEHTDELHGNKRIWLPGYGDVRASALRKLLKSNKEIAEMAEEMQNALDENGCISDCFWDTADNILADHI